MTSEYSTEYPCASPRLKRSVLLLFILLMGFAQLPAQTRTIRIIKPLDELIDNNESGWNTVIEWMKGAKNKIEILHKEPLRADDELYKAQVTTHSPLGAIIFQTGGILIDNGWLRILGSGNSRLNRGIMEWNKGRSFEEERHEPPFLLVADDVLGGFFAINNGELGNSIQNIYYFAPDTQEWEDMGIGYSDFIYWAFNGDIKMFYDSMRWNGWEQDVAKLDPSSAFSFDPALWSDYSDISELSRSTIPIAEIYAFTFQNITE